MGDAAETAVRSDEQAAEVALEPDDDVIDGDAVELGDATEATPEEAEALIAAESQAVAIRDERNISQPPANVLPSPVEWEATMTMARTIASTPFVPESYRGQPEAVVAAILTGREMGIGPMESLRQIHMIDGRPAFAADLMMSKMRSGGVVILDSSVSATRAYIKAKRSDTGEECEVEWTIEDATAAGLMGKKNWKTYPADMLWARCVGRLARRLGSDLLGGLVYSSEEMGDWDESGYGGSGYDTPMQQIVRPTASDGVVLLEGAPLGWTAISETLGEIDGSMDWVAWVSQALVALAGKTKVGDLDPTEKADCGIKVANGVRHLLDTLEGRDFPPPDREEIQGAFAWADAIDVKLDGPDGPLSPDEAAGDAVSEATDAATSSVSETTETQEEPSDAPLGTMPTGSTSDIPFGEED